MPKKHMKYFLIYGLQLEGEHEHSIYSLHQAKDLDEKEAHKILLRNHIYGYDDTEILDAHLENNGMDLGDGQTAVLFNSIREVTKQEYEIFRRIFYHLD